MLEIVVYCAGIHAGDCGLFLMYLEAGADLGLRNNFNQTPRLPIKFGCPHDFKCPVYRHLEKLDWLGGRCLVLTVGGLPRGTLP